MEEVRRSVGSRGRFPAKCPTGGLLAIAGNGTNLAVDANGRFDQATATAYAEAMNDYHLGWYEEPGDPLDFNLNHEVVNACDCAVATGENLFSRIDTTNLITG